MLKILFTLCLLIAVSCDIQPKNVPAQPVAVNIIGSSVMNVSATTDGLYYYIAYHDRTNNTAMTVIKVSTNLTNILWRTRISPGGGGYFYNSDIIYDGYNLYVGFADPRPTLVKLDMDGIALETNQLTTEESRYQRLIARNAVYFAYERFSWEMDSSGYREYYIPTITAVDPTDCNTIYWTMEQSPKAWSYALDMCFSGDFIEGGRHGFFLANNEAASRVRLKKIAVSPLDTYTIWSTNIANVQSRFIGMTSFNSNAYLVYHDAADEWQLYLTKVSPSGEILWNKKFGQYHSQNPICIREHNGFLYIAICQYNPDKWTTGPVSLIKINETGRVSWSVTCSSGHGVPGSILFSSGEVTLFYESDTLKAFRRKL